MTIIKIIGLVAFLVSKLILYLNIVFKPFYPQPVVNSDVGTQNNKISVKRSDFDAFEALAIDGRSTGKKGKHTYVIL